MMTSREHLDFLEFDRLQLTAEFATLQYLYATLGSLHMPVLLLRLRLTLAGTRRKPTTLSAIRFK